MGATMVGDTGPMLRASRSWAELHDHWQWELGRRLK
jgi:hypothetical protein